ncbi:NAD(P)/FAD-dependent oxidoreductase [Gordonia rhizosphera]|uniref:Putative oxidoreductase n=1 Tax=Gordonia rhizosphera NBRC 16068 TaxID=1108045 RepID=K6VCH8_9ACTN|nr:NAD(P)/FAD-dependent oxidoreductase [Gordonia rhizosphera]GAB93903.1 putative oxidoreductase [Gordonia rhizosphera NBRC 16068]
MNHHYDAIVVGGRCAGAATAMLLARGGMRVLVIDASRPGTDTLSTHALMRGGVLQLHRWGLLDDVVAAGTPAIRSTEFVYGDEIETVDIRPGGGISALRAPRRTVLDPLLLEAARAAGAEVRTPARVMRVLTEGGRVYGVEGIERGTGTRFRAAAPLVIGADGRNSTIAHAVDAPFRRRGVESGAVVYGYFPGLPRDRYHWAYRPGFAGGVIPTGDGLACVWAGTASTRFARERRTSLDATFRWLLAEADPRLARAISATSPVGTLRADPGRPGWVRASTGPGWALVGDAAYLKDPITAHGITDALRDAELLADAVLDTPVGRRARSDALTDYERIRDRLATPLFDVTERIASYAWDLDVLRGHLRDLSQAMRPEIDALLAIDQTPAA